jgi:hypothetical protein
MKTAKFSDLGHGEGRDGRDGQDCSRQHPVDLGRWCRSVLGRLCLKKGNTMFTLSEAKFHMLKNETQLSLLRCKLLPLSSTQLREFVFGNE